MAKIILNEKGFKVIEVNAQELLSIGCGIGGECLCDNCGKTESGTGYYIAVLNSWYCPSCYKSWCIRAKNHEKGNNADARIEAKNFGCYVMMLGL